MKSSTLSGDALSKEKVKSETVNHSRTEAVRAHLAGIYASDVVNMSCEELREYRTLDISEPKLNAAMFKLLVHEPKMVAYIIG